VTFGGGREREARQHASIVDPYGAGATGTLIATLFGTGEIEVLTQRVQQTDTRLDVQDIVDTIDVQGDRNGLGPADCADPVIVCDGKLGSGAQPAFLAGSRLVCIVGTP
jgi:hypothetical protein